MSLPSSPAIAPSPVTAGPPSPVKIVIERRAMPGRAIALRAWAERFLHEASSAAGYESGTVLTGASSTTHLMLLRFARDADLQAWQASARHAALMAEADALSHAGEVAQVRFGFETWFTLPDMPAPVTPPARWKMALVTWLALLPMVLALAVLLAPLRLPFLLQAAISTAVPVATLTWVVMPGVTRLLYEWLYARQATALP